MSEPIFAMRNNHGSTCGEPPLVRNDNRGRYYGYFENRYGEQWVFVYDRDKKTAELRGGDAGWENVFKVQDGSVAELILNREEREWLRACWMSATQKL